MAGQPKLRESAMNQDESAWWPIAREFNDHDMETDGGWQPNTTMEPVAYDCYIGDWLPVEEVCKEVARLRAERDRLREAGQRVEEDLRYFADANDGVSPVTARELADKLREAAAGEEVGDNG